MVEYVVELMAQVVTKTYLGLDLREHGNLVSGLLGLHRRPRTG